MTTQNDEDRLVRRREAAAMIGVSESTLRRLEPTELPPIVKNGDHLHSVKRLPETSSLGRGRASPVLRRHHGGADEVPRANEHPPLVEREPILPEYPCERKTDREENVVVLALERIAVRPRFAGAKAGGNDEKCEQLIGRAPLGENREDVVRKECLRRRGFPRTIEQQAPIVIRQRSGADQRGSVSEELSERRPHRGRVSNRERAERSGQRKQDAFVDRLRGVEVADEDHREWLRASSCAFRSECDEPRNARRVSLGKEPRAVFDVKRR